MKSMIFSFVLVIVKIARAIIKKRNCIAFISPASRGSLGDQALVQGLYDALVESDLELVEILVLKGQIPQKLHQVDHKVLGDYCASRFDSIKFLFDTIRFKGLIVIGADTLDGTYDLDKNLFWMDLCSISVKTGLPASIVSFSFSDNPRDKVIEKIRTCPDEILFCSRDYYSKVRFEERTGKCCTLTADLAFLMRPYTRNIKIEKAKAWVCERKSDGDVVIALNANYLNRGSERESLENSYVDAIVYLSESYANVAFLLIAHDFREGQSDFFVLRNIWSKVIGLERNVKIMILDGPYDCWDAKSALDNVDFIFSGRMHLAIAGLSIGKPVYCIAYKNKFEGLMHHFHLDSNLISLEDSVRDGYLSEWFKYAYENYKSDKEIVLSRLDDVKCLSRSNFGGFV